MINPEIPFVLSVLAFFMSIVALSVAIFAACRDEEEK